MAASISTDILTTSNTDHARSREMQFEALGRYIATLGADDTLCRENIRIRHATGLGTGGPGIAGGGTYVDVTAPFVDMPLQVQFLFRNGAPTFYPVGNPPNRNTTNTNKFDEFGGAELTGLTLQNIIRTPAGLYGGNLITIGGGAFVNGVGWGWTSLASLTEPCHNLPPGTYSPFYGPGCWGPANTTFAAVRPDT